MPELFADFDLDRRAPRGQRLLRLLGGSVAAHLAFVLAVLYVPAVRDTFQLASTLSGFRVVDEAYTQTDIRERATIINIADTKLYYPPGYFTQGEVVAPPDVTFVAQVRPPAPPPQFRAPRPRPTPVPSPSPTPSPSPSPSPSPAASPVVATNTQPGTQATPGANASPTPVEPQTVAEAEAAARKANVEKFPTINTRPFTDLLAKGRKLKDAGALNLNGTLEMSVEADRNPDGTLANVEVTGASASDAQLHELAKAFIAALSESKVLAALQDTHHLKLQFKLDDKDLSVRVTTEVADADNATRLARGYNMLLFIGAQSKQGRDEEAIFKNIHIAAEASQIVLTFNMPRAAAGDLISKLAKKTEATGPST